MSRRSRNLCLIHEDGLARVAAILPGGAADQALQELKRRRADGEDVHAFEVLCESMLVVGPMPTGNA